MNKLDRHIGSKVLKYSTLVAICLSISFAKKYKILGDKIYFFCLKYTEIPCFYVPLE